MNMPSSTGGGSGGGGGGISSSNTNSNEHITRDELLCEVICAIADFAVDLAMNVSQKTGRQYTPKILQQQRKRLRRQPSVDDPTKPRKPQTAYTSWCEHIRQKVREKDPSRALQIKDLADMWKHLPEHEKAPWERKANEMKEKYHMDMCAWRSQSVQKTNENMQQGGGGASNIHNSMQNANQMLNVPVASGGYPPHYGQYTIDKNK